MLKEDTVKITRKDLDETVEKELRIAEALLNYQIKNNFSDWYLNDDNYIFENGIITRRDKQGVDNYVKTKTANSKSNRAGR